MPDSELRAKPESELVGGIIRNGAKTRFTPHRINLRQRLGFFVGFPLGKPTLKGGVIIFERNICIP